MAKNEKELALNYCEDTILLRDKIEESFLELGARLFKIRNEELFKGQYESYPLFLEELKISESVASRLVTVWRTFVDEYQLSPAKLLRIGWSDLYQVSRVTKDKDEVLELIEKGQVLSSGDLRKEMLEVSTGIEMAQCDHPQAYVIKVCPTCHFKEKIYSND
jgi:hypothetical protein